MTLPEELQPVPPDVIMLCWKKCEGKKSEGHFDN
jgi:hypothetical protein